MNMVQGNWRKDVWFLWDTFEALVGVAYSWD